MIFWFCNELFAEFGSWNKVALYMENIILVLCLVYLQMIRYAFTIAELSECG